MGSDGEDDGEDDGTADRVGPDEGGGDGITDWVGLDEGTWLILGAVESVGDADGVLDSVGCWLVVGA